MCILRKLEKRIFLEAVLLTHPLLFSVHLKKKPLVTEAMNVFPTD